MKIGANLHSFVRRYWPLLIAASALVALITAAVGQTTPVTGAAEAAERGRDAAPTPTTEAQASTAGEQRMPSSVKEALAQFLEADDAARTNEGPVEIENHINELYLPSIFGSGRGPAKTPVPRPTREPEDGAYVTVTIWTNPNIRVARNGVQAYEVRVANHGDGGADSVSVKLPYNKAQMVVTDSRFGSRADWVSSLTDTQVTINFGELDENEARSGTIFMKVNGSLVDNTVLPMRASFTWDDARDGGDGTSNWAPILVGSGNDSAPWVWMSVDPPYSFAGQIFHFYSDRFTPGEPIMTWLNTPSGVKALTLRGTTDKYGRVWLSFDSKGLSSGKYQLVLYGTHSKMTGIRTFNVW